MKYLAIILLLFCSCTTKKIDHRIEPSRSFNMSNSNGLAWYQDLSKLNGWEVVDAYQSIDNNYYLSLKKNGEFILLESHFGTMNYYRTIINSFPDTTIVLQFKTPIRLKSERTNTGHEKSN